MDKKGQGLSMNTIIIAALALLVLVILSMIFMNRLGIFVSESKSCSQNGGRCVGITESCPAGMTDRVIGNIKCHDSSGDTENTQKCCIAGE